MKRICKYCGKEFEAHGTQQYCLGPHYATCEICGKQFEVNPRHPKTTCSRSCASKLRLRSIQKCEKVCEICGKSFVPINNTSRYCSGPHYRPCPICGKPVEFTEPSSDPACCSKECTKELRRRTSINKYGTDVPSQSDEVRQKLSESGFKSIKRRKKTCLNKYGYEYDSQSLIIRQKISNTMSSIEYQHKMDQLYMDKYNYHHPSQIPEVRSKVRINQFNIFAIDGTRVDSSYEKEVYNSLVRSNINFSYQAKTIEYEYNKKIHSTIIDFEINGLLFEVKGGHLMNGCYDYAGVPIDIKLLVYASHNVILITDDLGLHKIEEFNYQNKTTLTGIHIKLFNDVKLTLDDILNINR